MRELRQLCRDANVDSSKCLEKRDLVDLALENDIDPSAPKPEEEEEEEDDDDDSDDDYEPGDTDDSVSDEECVCPRALLFVTLPTVSCGGFEQRFNGRTRHWPLAEQCAGAGAGAVVGQVHDRHPTAELRGELHIPAPPRAPHRAHAALPTQRLSLGARPEMGAGAGHGHDR